MPTVTFSLVSQRNKLVSDSPWMVAVRGNASGAIHPGDVQLKPAAGEIVLDVAPDRYAVDVEVPGFRRFSGTFQIGIKAVAKTIKLENRCTLLPSVSDLHPEQTRLLETLDPTRSAGAIWKELSDNKSATFFQVSYALAHVLQPSGTPVSALVERVVRVGGADLTAPDTAGTMRTVIGWRMHVTFIGGSQIDVQLADAGFKRDAGTAHPTHGRFGYVRSFREKRGAPKLQVVTDYEGVGADVDCDAGKFHQSAPHDVYKDLKKRFPQMAKVYRVR